MFLFNVRWLGWPVVDQKAVSEAAVLFVCCPCLVACCVCLPCSLLVGLLSFHSPECFRGGLDSRQSRLISTKDILKRIVIALGSCLPYPSVPEALGSVLGPLPPWCLCRSLGALSHQL